MPSTTANPPTARRLWNTVLAEYAVRRPAMTAAVHKATVADVRRRARLLTGVVSGSAALPYNSESAS